MFIQAFLVAFNGKCPRFYIVSRQLCGLKVNLTLRSGGQCVVCNCLLNLPLTLCIFCRLSLRPLPGAVCLSNPAVFRPIFRPAVKKCLCSYLPDHLSDFSNSSKRFKIFSCSSNFREYSSIDRAACTLVCPFCLSSSITARSASIAPVMLCRPHWAARLICSPCSRWSSAAKVGSDKYDRNALGDTPRRPCLAGLLQ